VYPGRGQNNDTRDDEKKSTFPRLGNSDTRWKFSSRTILHRQWALHSSQVQAMSNAAVWWFFCTPSYIQSSHWRSDLIRVGYWIQPRLYMAFCAIYSLLFNDNLVLIHWYSLRKECEPSWTCHLCWFLMELTRVEFFLFRQILVPRAYADFGFDGIGHRRPRLHSYQRFCFKLTIPPRSWFFQFSTTGDTILLCFLRLSAISLVSPLMDYDSYDAILHHIFRSVRFLSPH